MDLGARRVDVGQAADVSWVVLADPDSAEAQSILIEREFVSRRTVRLCTDTTPTSLRVPRHFAFTIAYLKRDWEAGPRSAVEMTVWMRVVINRDPNGRRPHNRSSQ